jgi:cytochrome c biogenesis protein CcdA/thiol-disulfide isomerase/thioredoxin
MLLLLISVIAGFLTILAPCVLPLLPVIIGGSVGSEASNRYRPYIIAASLAGSIIVFTLILKISTTLAGVPSAALYIFSGGLIIALGLASLMPEAWEWLVIRLNLQAASQRFLGQSEGDKRKYVGPILIGVALGPVFSSCSPTYAFILATVLPGSFAAGLGYLVAYSVALVVALLVVSVAGRKLMARLGWALDTHSLFRRIIGVLFIVVGLTVATGQEVAVEVWVGNHLPFDETRLEQALLNVVHPGVAQKLAGASNVGNTSALNVQPTPEPQLAGLTNWINSSPLELSALKGKVVLVDFWTYSCVNCNRALPYVETWYKAYAADGFVVIGVHTPEFAFEHVASNVQAAVKADGITYPVALDNNDDTWNAFQNDSWPADYLIDKSGYIRYIALGEGNYNVTEKAIQELLGVSAPPKTPTSIVPISSDQTPETYFGTNRASGYEGNPDETGGTHNFSKTSSLDADSWTLSGSWQINPENITSESGSSTLTFNTQAKDVYVVAGSANNSPETVDVGLPSAAAGQYGVDAPGGKATVGMSRLYHIVSLKSAGTTTVTLTVPKGVSLYTFTFGS